MPLARWQPKSVNKTQQPRIAPTGNQINRTGKQAMKPKRRRREGKTKGVRRSKRTPKPAGE